MSGSGRGRGWLKLDKNRPVGEPTSNANLESPIKSSWLEDEPTQTGVSNNFGGDALAQEFNMISFNQQQGVKLLSLVEKINLSDDGIQFNKKLKSIVLFWQADCKSDKEVRDTFTYVFKKCATCIDLGTKLTTIVSAHSFTTLEIHEVKIRSLFIDSIQSVFDGNPQLKITNPVLFRNTFRMLGDFYHKARLSNGNVIGVLGGFVAHYLKLLLQSDDYWDFELFTSQLYLNGAAISENCNHDLLDIGFEIRNTLAEGRPNKPLPRIWLLLGLDVINHRFGLLPTDLHRFYQEKLGEEAMAKFQGNRIKLSIQPVHVNKVFDGYQSTVNVLQVTPPESKSPINDQLNNSHNHYSIPTDAPQHYGPPPSQNYNSHNYNAEVGDWNNTNEFKVGMNNQEKAGRPILGAGARLQRIRTAEEASNAASTQDSGKENSAGWDNSQKLGSKNWSSSNKNNKGYGGNKSKGWEHDDRFDKNY